MEIIASLVRPGNAVSHENYAEDNNKSRTEIKRTYGAVLEYVLDRKCARAVIFEHVDDGEGIIFDVLENNVETLPDLLFSMHAISYLAFPNSSLDNEKPASATRAAEILRSQINPSE